MTITLDIPIAPPSKVQPPQSPLVKLQREPDFYQHAWEEVRPFLLEMADELVRFWGFEKEEPENGETPLFVRLHKSGSDGSVILVELPYSISGLLDHPVRHDPSHTNTPTNIDTILPIQISTILTAESPSSSVLPSPSSSLSPPPHTYISPNHPTHIHTPHLVIPPLAEIIYMLQCFLVGLSTDDKDIQMVGLPEVRWLLKREMVLREAFGCTYFRYLVDAAREG